MDRKDITFADLGGARRGHGVRSARYQHSLKADIDTADVLDTAVIPTLHREASAADFIAVAAVDIMRGAVIKVVATMADVDITALDSALAFTRPMAMPLPSAIPRGFMIAMATGKFIRVARFLTLIESSRWTRLVLANLPLGRPWLKSVYRVFSVGG